MNGFAPDPGRPQNAPGDIVTPGEKGEYGVCKTCCMCACIG